MRLLVVLGEGGHTRQMLQLLDQLGPQYEYHYLIAAEDQLSEDKIRLSGPVYRAGRPRSKVKGHTDSLPMAAWHTLHSLGRPRCWANYWARPSSTSKAPRASSA